MSDLAAAIAEARANVTRETLPTVLGDPPQLRQVFQNLIANAVKFHGPSEAPRMHILATQKPGSWTISVSDNGIGIEPQYQERIFALFQRLHTRADYAGTGIGLAICRKIVERHGGKICVESEPGCGTTFRFTLPTLLANCYITKPVDLEQFINVVKSIEDFWLTIVTLPHQT